MGETRLAAPPHYRQQTEHSHSVAGWQTNRKYSVHIGQTGKGMASKTASIAGVSDSASLEHQQGDMPCKEGGGRWMISWDGVLPVACEGVSAEAALNIPYLG